MKTIHIPADTHQKLTFYKFTNGFGSFGEAIEALLDMAASNPRRHQMLILSLFNFPFFHNPPFFCAAPRYRSRGDTAAPRAQEEE